MLLDQSYTEPVILPNLSIAPYDLFWDLETVLLVLMIDFSKITFDGVIVKEDLLAYSEWSGDRKGSAASRIAAEHFEKLAELAARLPRGYCAEGAQDGPFDYEEAAQDRELPGLTIVDLLRVITYVSERPSSALAEQFPGLQFPCC
jgi:hypothetical protein